MFRFRKKTVSDLNRPGENSDSQRDSESDSHDTDWTSSAQTDSDENQVPFRKPPPRPPARRPVPPPPLPPRHGAPKQQQRPSFFTKLSLTSKPAAIPQPTPEQRRSIKKTLQADDRKSSSRSPTPPERRPSNFSRNPSSMTITSNNSPSNPPRHRSSSGRRKPTSPDYPATSMVPVNDTQYQMLAYTKLAPSEMPIQMPSFDPSSILAPGEQCSAPPPPPRRASLQGESGIKARMQEVLSCCIIVCVITAGVSLYVLKLITIGPMAPAGPTSIPVFLDCQDAQEKHNARNSIKISPDGGTSFSVSCDQDTSGGGWTIIQRRSSTDTINFVQNWTTYGEGFGDLMHAHWLGNNRIHRLTKLRTYFLCVLLRSPAGTIEMAYYRDFRIGSEKRGYVLHLSHFIGGTAGDAMSENNGHKFSTFDMDNDKTEKSCASNGNGGWWFTDCGRVNLNTKGANDLMWYDMEKERDLFPSASVMMVRRKFPIL